MSPEETRRIVAAELASLGRDFDDVFASFEDVPLGSASVAQARGCFAAFGASCIATPLRCV